MPWFAPFIVRDVTTSRGRFVHLEFPAGLDIDAEAFAELWRAFPTRTAARWTVRRTSHLFS